MHPTNADWKTAPKYPPDRLQIQVTNVCNADCTFCGYQFLEDEKGYLEDSHFYSCVDQFVAMGGRHIDFTPVVGDLLVDKQIFTKLNYATKEKKVPIVRFYTNGILLSRKAYPQQLLDAGPTEVVFSLPGFERELYERVYRNRSYKSMMRGVSAFMKLNAEAGFPIRVKFALKPDIPFDEAVHTEDFKTMIEPWLERMDYLVHVKDLDNWGGALKPEHLTGNMTMVEAIPVSEKTKPCYFTYFLSLMVDGHIRLCGCRFNDGTEYDDLVIGHIDETPLLELWDGANARRVREDFTRGKMASVCRTCSHYGPYSGKERAEFTIQEFIDQHAK